MVKRLKNSIPAFVMALLVVSLGWTGCSKSGSANNATESQVSDVRNDQVAVPSGDGEEASDTDIDDEETDENAPYAAMANTDVDWSEFDATRGNNPQAAPVMPPQDDKPKVKLRDHEVDGGVDKRVVQKVVRQHTPELRECYEKELAVTPNLSGQLLFRWVISPQGAVEDVSILENTTNNTNLESCITDAIKFWRFPSPKGGGKAVVQYPFVFEM